MWEKEKSKQRRREKSSQQKFFKKTSELIDFISLRRYITQKVFFSLRLYDIKSQKRNFQSTSISYYLSQRLKHLDVISYLIWNLIVNLLSFAMFSKTRQIVIRFVKLSYFNINISHFDQQEVSFYTHLNVSFSLSIFFVIFQSSFNIVKL